MKTVKVLWSVCLALVVLIGYQNCGEGFKAPTGSLGSLSSQCKATIQEKFASLNEDLSSIDCDDADSYTCELRVFKPGVDNSIELGEDCVKDASGKSVCLTLDIRSFNTEGARSVASVEAGEFNEGGEYNRIEANCHHNNSYRGVATFVGESDDLLKAFEQARNSCKAAKRGGS